MAQESQIAPEALPEDSIPSTSSSNAPQDTSSSTGKSAPFCFVENADFLEFAKMVRPSYSLPSRKALATRMLDQAYEELKTKVNNMLENAKHITIATDAWTDVNGQSAINFIAMTPTPIFYEAVYTRESRHTAAYLSNTTADIINRIGAGKVVAVVTDNAPSNVSAWNMLAGQFSDTMLTCIGCSAHWLNLLAKDITRLEAYTLVLSDAVEVIKKFKNKHILSAKLGDMQLR